MTTITPQKMTLPDLILSHHPDHTEQRKRAIEMLFNNPALAVRIALECRETQGRKVADRFRAELEKEQEKRTT